MRTHGQPDVEKLWNLFHDHSFRRSHKHRKPCTIRIVQAYSHLMQVAYRFTLIPLERRAGVLSVRMRGVRDFSYKPTFILFKNNSAVRP